MERVGSEPCEAVPFATHVSALGVNVYVVMAAWTSAWLTSKAPSQKAAARRGWIGMFMGRRYGEETDCRCLMHRAGVGPSAERETAIEAVSLKQAQRSVGRTADYLEAATRREGRYR